MENSPENLQLRMTLCNILGMYLTEINDKHALNMVESLKRKRATAQLSIREKYITDHLEARKLM